MKNKQYRLITESGKVLMGGETYNRRGAEKWWNDLDGTWTAESGKAEKIYIDEV